MRGTIELRPSEMPSRYFVRYLEGGSRILPGIYLNTGNIELDFSQKAVIIASETLSALRNGDMTSQQADTFYNTFGFTPKQAHDLAHVEGL